MSFTAVNKNIGMISLTMTRSLYKLFSEGQIGNLKLKNRLVRSATWDPCILQDRQMTDEVLGIYRNLALGGTGLIITGGFPVASSDAIPPSDEIEAALSLYNDLRVEGISRLAQIVHEAAPDCKIIIQLETGELGKTPSQIPSPFGESPQSPFTTREINAIVASFIQAIAAAKTDGFDGVQLHAAHGGFLSRFLSPYSNQRTDEYGGTVHNRVRIVRKIIDGARQIIGDFPILIKMNGTDYLEGGIDRNSFPELAKEIEIAGIDAVEVSGGMWDCLVRSERELGFFPGPSPDAHYRISQRKQQSYFLSYAEALDLGIPVILVGGNRNVEHLETILNRSNVDFIALCRPLIAEPDLPRRWLEGRGKVGTRCVSCNACLFDMFVHSGKETPGPVHCVYKENKGMVKTARGWVTHWVEQNMEQKKS